MNTPTKHLTGRLLAGMTREEAASLLYISEKTLQRIENGEQPCRPETAILMAKIYGYPWVADPNVPDDYRPKPAANALLGYMKELEDVKRILPRLTDILSNGRVDPGEEEDHEMCIKEIREARRASRDLEYAI